MKKPWPVFVLVHVTPAVVLAHVTEPTLESWPYGSGVAWRLSAVSPAQTKRPGPEGFTASPWPKSTTVEQEAGRGGGDQLRLEMSHRAPPERMMQPMLPEGDRKSDRWTVTAAG